MYRRHFPARFVQHKSRCQSVDGSGNEMNHAATDSDSPRTVICRLRCTPEGFLDNEQRTCALHLMQRTRQFATSAPVSVWYSCVRSEVRRYDLATFDEPLASIRRFVDHRTERLTSNTGFHEVLSWDTFNPQECRTLNSRAHLYRRLPDLEGMYERTVSNNVKYPLVQAVPGVNAGFVLPRPLLLGTRQ